MKRLQNDKQREGNTKSGNIKYKTLTKKPAWEGYQYFSMISVKTIDIKDTVSIFFYFQEVGKQCVDFLGISNSLKLQPFILLNNKQLLDEFLRDMKNY